MKIEFFFSETEGKSETGEKWIIT